MDILYGTLIFALWTLLLTGLRFITVTGHELGHALSLLSMQKGRVTIYIGSMGDPTGGFHLHFKRLDVFIKYNPFKWNSGLCVPHTKELSVNRQLIFIAMGPVASLLLIIFPSLVVGYSTLGPGYKMVFFFTAFSAFTDFFGSAFPRPQPIPLYGGGSTYNDASGIRQLLIFKKIKHDYELACAVYKNKEYAQAAPYFDRILEAGWRDDQMLRMATFTHIQTRNYERATVLSEKLKAKGNMDSDDFARAGHIYHFNRQFEKAAENFRKALRLNPGNQYAQEQLSIVEQNI